MLSLCKIVTFGAGWQIAGGDADDVRVCGAHPWQSQWLVFANGDCCGTAMCDVLCYKGACARRAAAATAKNMKFSPHARQQGKKWAATSLNRMRKGRDQIVVLMKFCCGGRSGSQRRRRGLRAATSSLRRQRDTMCRRFWQRTVTTRAKLQGVT